MTEKTDSDVIVIGAGLAGLSCAAHLAKAGRRVIVLEQHTRPGGLWTSFSRRGVIFDISTHWVTDPEALNRTLEGLGAPTVDFVQLDHLGRYLGSPKSKGSAGAAGTRPTPLTAAAIPSWDIVVGQDVAGFKESVRESFPTVYEEGLDRLCAQALEISRLLDTLPIQSPELTPLRERLGVALRRLPHVAQIRRLRRTSAEAYFAELFPGDGLAGLRAALCSLAPVPDISAIGPLAMLGTGLRGKVYAPRGGSRRLAEAFAEAAVRNGAEIRYSAKVVSILTADGAVQGVRLDGGATLAAPTVVAAIDAKQTFYGLLDPQLVPDSYRRLLEAKSISEPYGLISLVTTLEPAALGFDGTDVFVCPSTDVEVLRSKEPDDCAFMLTFPQYVEPGADPVLRGVQILVPAAWSWREHWETWPTPERGADYRDLKNEWSAKIIARVQEYLPRLTSHLVTVDVATPITFYRYTLNTEGAPTGWHHMDRPCWKQRVTFLRGLYQAGHWVGPSGAVPVVTSGRWAADLVLSRKR